MELTARLRHDGLVVESLLAQSARIPAALAAPPQAFADVCGSSPWLLERRDDSRPVTCVFHALSPREGRIVLAGAGLHAEARYVLGPEGCIRFTLTEETRRMLRLLDEMGVLHLLDAVSWKASATVWPFAQPAAGPSFLFPDRPSPGQPRPPRYHTMKRSFLSSSSTACCRCRPLPARASTCNSCCDGSQKQSQRGSQALAAGAGPHERRGGAKFFLAARQPN